MTSLLILCFHQYYPYIINTVVTSVNTHYSNCSVSVDQVVCMFLGTPPFLFLVNYCLFACFGKSGSVESD